MNRNKFRERIKRIISLDNISVDPQKITTMGGLNRSPNHTWHITLPLLLLLIMCFPWIEKYSINYLLNNVFYKEIAFTGTTSPIRKVPIWTELSTQERTSNYEQLPAHKLMEIPSYDTTSMKNGTLLAAASDADINTYITYPVPNLGNYQLDGTEGSGSHPGVDIKVPTNTPVFAIANGIVETVKNSPTGFGKHIVIFHPNAPLLSNPQKKIGMYSNYAHLNAIQVKEGDIIMKGEQIGLSGQTGMTTAPHLHIQIDTPDAPFHPYWPFSWNDLKKHGITSYFDGVRKAIGRKNAQKYTIHPIRYIEKFANYKNVNAILVQKSKETKSVPEDIKKKPLFSSAPKIAPINSIKKSEPIKQIPIQNNGSKDVLEILVDNYYIPGEEKTLELKINDNNLLVNNGQIKFSSNTPNIIFKPPYVTAKNISNNRVSAKVLSIGKKPFKISVNTEKGTFKSSSIRPYIFRDVSLYDNSAKAIEYLKNKRIINGYSDGEFKPDNFINRAEATKILLTAFNSKITRYKQSSFTDVPSNAWFSDYVNYAQKQGFIKGFIDKTFRPAKNITRAEFLKIALSITKINKENYKNKSLYKDTPEKAWYAPYFRVSKEYGLLDMKKGGSIAPNIYITREEAAEAIYRIITRVLKK